jgi:hypothetical protein
LRGCRDGERAHRYADQGHKRNLHHEFLLLPHEPQLRPNLSELVHLLNARPRRRFRG